MPRWLQPVWHTAYLESLHADRTIQTRRNNLWFFVEYDALFAHYGIRRVDALRHARPIEDEPVGLFVRGVEPGRRDAIAGWWLGNGIAMDTVEQQDMASALEDQLESLFEIELEIQSEG
jgi:hypothetical protein